MANLIPALNTAADIAWAVEETITTPGPDFSHGKLASVAAAITFVISTFFC